MNEKKKKRSTGEELETYVNDKFSFDIYEFVKKNPALFGCPPLEFLKLLRATFNEIFQNVGKPMKIAESLKDDFPNRVYFLKKLESLMRKKIDDHELESRWAFELPGVRDSHGKMLNEMLEIIRDVREQAEQEEIENETVYQRAERMSREAFAFIATLKDEAQQLKHLKKTKIQIDADFGMMDRLDFDMQVRDGNKTPYAKLAREIEKRESLLKLEKLNSIEPKAENQNGKPSKKNKDLTLDRAALFFNYLFTSAKVNCANTKKAEIISFFTGYSTNTIKDKFSKLHSKVDDNYIEYEKDMNFVRRQFETLGMPEVVEKIGNDLDIK